MKAAWAGMVFAFAACVQARADPDLLTRAQGGDAQAQADLGEKYLTGDGVPEDRAAAWKWFNLSAAQGDPQAEFRLGQLCTHLDLTQDAEIPHDPERDYGAEAHAWYAKAAAQNYAPAEFELGSTAVGKTAFDWYLRAAQHGYRPALTTVAQAYADGRDTPRNYAAALQWYKAAAARGDASAAFRIGVLYRNGLGVPKDAAEAERWFRQAADGGNPSAIALRRADRQPPLAQCAAAPAGLNLVEHTSTSVLFAAPDDARKPETLARDDAGLAAPFVDFRLRAGDLTITLRQRLGRRAATDSGDGLVAYGGGDARLHGESASDGSGALSIEWQDVGRTHSTVALRIEYASGAAPAACAVMRSARLLEPVSELSAIRSARSGPKRCATLRNVDGVERNVCVGDIVTRDFGKIEKITAAGVELVELHPNGRGGWKESALTLPLRH